MDLALEHNILTMCLLFILEITLKWLTTIKCFTTVIELYKRQILDRHIIYKTIIIIVH